MVRTTTMAPAKLGRKKRAPPSSAIATASTSPSSIVASSAVAAVQSDVTGAASNNSQAVDESTMSMDTVAAYYEHLRSDIERVVLRLQAALWLHKVIAVMVVNLFMYDLHVQMHQILLVAWAALWLGRGFIIDRSVEMSTRVNVNVRVTVVRVVALVIFINAALALHYHVWETIPRNAIILLVIIAGMDIQSISRLQSSIGFADAAIRDIGEMVFIILIVSVQYNELSNLIYDRIAIAFVVVTLVIHIAVVHGIQYALFAMPWTGEDQARRSQHRRWDAIETVARTFDLSDGGKPLTPSKRKKGPKHSSSSRGSSALMRNQAGGSSIAQDASRAAVSGSLEMVSYCVALQTLTVAQQMLVTTFVLHSWELCSIVMCTSVHLLIDVLLLHASLARPYPLHLSVHESVGIATI